MLRNRTNKNYWSTEGVQINIYTFTLIKLKKNKKVPFTQSIKDFWLNKQQMCRSLLFNTVVFTIPILRLPFHNHKDEINFSYIVFLWKP